MCQIATTMSPISSMRPLGCINLASLHSHNYNGQVSGDSHQLISFNGNWVTGDWAPLTPADFSLELLLAIGIMQNCVYGSSACMVTCSQPAKPYSIQKCFLKVAALKQHRTMHHHIIESTEFDLHVQKICPN